MLEAGYSVSYSNCKRGLSLYDNVMVKQAIERIQASNKVDTTRTIQSVDQMQQAAYDMAMKHNQPSAAVSAAVAIARLYGMDKDNDLATDQSRELADSEQAEAKRLASIRLLTG